MSSRVVLSPTVVRHTLWYFGDRNLGEDGGSFVARLFQLIAVADMENRGKLSEHWPEHVSAFAVAATTPWGMDWLRGLAKAAEVDVDQLDMIGADRG
ncbi:MAG: hypothetical protein JSS74_10855 [Actinobacteria bacterium]|nr:hypothetical protein [Actinomycetota bacterium]